MGITEEQAQAAETEWIEAWRRGPTRTRWVELPPQVGDPAPDLELRTSDGETIRLSDLWGDGPALVLFWRHYGCSCGIDRAQRLRAEYADYVALGANVAVIGQGEPARSAAYKALHGLPCAVLCDPARSAYAAYGLLEGAPEHVVYDAPEEFLNRDLAAGLELAAARRDTDRRVVDSPWQLPGEFVVDRAGSIRLAYRYQYCEDFPDPRVLTAALSLAR